MRQDRVQAVAEQTITLAQTVATVVEAEVEEHMDKTVVTVATPVAVMALEAPRTIL